MTEPETLPHYVDSNRLERFVNYEVVGKTALRVQRWRDQWKLKRRQPRPDSPLNPPLQCVAYMKEIMSRKICSVLPTPHHGRIAKNLMLRMLRIIG